MIKLKFKIVIFRYNKIIVKKKMFYSGYYNENLTMKEVLNDIALKKCKDHKEHGILIINFRDMLWKYYFKNEAQLVDERNVCIYYNYKLKDLSEQFHFENNRLEVWIDPGIGGYVGKNVGIHYFFHTNEKDIHHTPHIHVKNGNIEFRVDLYNLKIMDKKTFKSKSKTKMAIEMIKLNQNDLINYWHKVVIKGESIKFKMYFPYNK